MAQALNAPNAPTLPPPPMSVGALGWARENLFGSWLNGALTVVSLAAIAVGLWYSLAWTFFSADWEVIVKLGGRFVIGQYNAETSCPGQNCFWRPQVGLLMATALLGAFWAITASASVKRAAFAVALVSAAFAFLPYGLDEVGWTVRLPLANYSLASWEGVMGWDVRLLLLANIPALGAGWAIGRYTPLNTPGRAVAASVGAFLLTLILLRGGFLGLEPVVVEKWGGLMLNILLALTGIVFSFPLGVALALGRRSNLPVLKLLCVFFIEVMRGMPLITLLFMSQVLVPLAFPENFPLNSVTRAAIVIILFSAAYMAENVRGGLQSLHPGQAQASRALGLAAWQTTLFISLPQAIRNVIPALANQFIALFKDTSLVYIIAMLDIVQIGRAFIQGNTEYLLHARELFIFISIVFFVFTYAMSYFSKRLEAHLGVGRR